MRVHSRGEKGRDNRVVRIQPQDMGFKWLKKEEDRSMTVRFQARETGFSAYHESYEMAWLQREGMGNR